jgi:hypothetical protein
MFIKTDSVEADFFHELELFYMVLISSRAELTFVILSTHRVLQAPFEIFDVGTEIKCENLHAVSSSG